MVFPPHTPALRFCSFSGSSFPWGHTASPPHLCPCGFCLEYVPLLPHAFSPALAETLSLPESCPWSPRGEDPLCPHHSTRFAQIGCESSRGSACQCGRRGFDPWVGKIPWEKEMAAHSSILAWRIPWTEEPGGPQSMRSQRVRHNLATEHICLRLEGLGVRLGEGGMWRVTFPLVGLALCPSHDARPTRAHALPLPLPGRPLLCPADGEGHNTRGETHFC